MEELVVVGVLEQMELFGGAYRRKRVLVTGHTGFKGAWLSIWLTQLGAEVAGYANGVPTTPSLFESSKIGEKILDRRGDVRDLEGLQRVVREFKPQFVFHLAAQAIVSTSYADPLETFSTNVMGTATVLEALRGIDWPCVAVVITSDKVYDNVEWPWGYRETDHLGGRDVYSGSKGGADLAFNSYCQSFFNDPECPVRLASARAGNVIGGGDWAADRIVADCIRAWWAGATVKIRSPNATRPWQHVLEPLSGYLTLGSKLSGEKTLHGEAFNFGPRAEQNATVLQLLQSLAGIWGFEREADSYEIIENRPFHEAGLLKLNIDKAMLRLRWEPNLSYEECVGMTGTWYKSAVDGAVSVLALTEEQINEYCLLATKRRRAWATNDK